MVLLLSYDTTDTPSNAWLFPDKHKDESQVALDVARSFNTFPKGKYLWHDFMLLKIPTNHSRHQAQDEESAAK